MPNIDKETIKNLTELCRIDCKEDEQLSLMNDLQKILNLVSQLDEVDTEHVKPCNHVLDDMVNVEREDLVKDVMPREVFLNNAPSHTGGMIKVPPVMK